MSREQLADPNLSLDCQGGCVNKIICTECNPKICRCGPQCQNRRFQLHQDALIYPIHCGAKGWGLAAGENISKGQFIIQYTGEVLSINSEEGRRRIMEYSVSFLWIVLGFKSDWLSLFIFFDYHGFFPFDLFSLRVFQSPSSIHEEQKSTCTYLMNIGRNEVIDPTYRGNMARFMNHSCNPNCITQKWNVLGETTVGIFAERDIREGEELTFDYQFDCFKTPLTKCLCGANSCKGYLGLIPANYTYQEWERKMDTLPCSICGENTEDDDDKLLLCDTCNNGFHTFCLNITEIPKDAWFCQECKKQKEEDANKREEISDDSPEVERKANLLNIFEEEDNDSYSDDELMEFNKGLDDASAEKDIEMFIDRFNMDKELQEIAITELLEAEGRKRKPKKKPKNSKGLKNPTKLTPPNQKKPSDIGEINPNPQSPDAQVQNTPVVANPKKEIFDKTKQAVESVFLKRFWASEEFSKMNSQSIMDQVIKSGGITTKQNIILSNLELAIFKEHIFKIVAQKMRTRMFWDNADKATYEISVKNREFNVIGTAEQLEIVKNIFALLFDVIEEHKEECGYAEACIFFPAIFMKRILGNSHSNMYERVSFRFYCRTD